MLFNRGRPFEIVGVYGTAALISHFNLKFLKLKDLGGI